MRRQCLSAVLSIAAVAVLWAQSAGATFAHPTYTGPQIDFTLIEETTQVPAFGPADPEPIWGAPSGAGNTLNFSPTLFTATGSFGTFDETHSTLEVHMSALNPLVDPITFITVTESGEVDISGAGTFASGAILLMGGTITLTTATAVETFTWGGAGAQAGPATFDVGVTSPGTTFLDLVSNFGVTAFTGSIVFDTAALLASRGVFDATESVVLQYNDKIQAYSEAGSVVEVRKTSASIAVVPEPMTGVLFAGGLVALSIHARNNRRRV